MLLIGPPGAGKSHIAQALGYHAVKGGSVVLYRSIFDVVRDLLHVVDDQQVGAEMAVHHVLLLIYGLVLVMKQLPKRSGEYLFEIIMRRNQVRSTIMTSNCPLEDWGKLIGDVPAAIAILDRFLHNVAACAAAPRSPNRRKETTRATAAF